MVVKVLSLFDGLACGMLAFMKAGVQVNNYYAYEIDKYAIQTATQNFPQIQECGDVFEGDYKQYEGIDYLIGGSPCQRWSIAQSPDKRETTASGIGWELFSQYVRALKESKPKYFIYENNKSMAKAIRESISEAFGFEPILINSALLSAQNRQRLYWVGKRNADGTYSKVEVEQPKDKGILLKDVLDSGMDLTANSKSYTLTASYNGAVPWDTIERSRKTMVAEPVNVTAEGKAQCLRSTCYKDGIRNIAGNKIDRKTGVAEPIRCFTLPREDAIQTQSKQYRVYDVNVKSTILCAECGGMGAKTGLYAIPVEFDKNIPVKAVSVVDFKAYKVYKVKDGHITIKDKQYPIQLQDGYYIIRKLTVTECKRLQTVPEWYEFPVSDTRAYSMLGNGWTVDVIVHLINATKNT